MPFKRLMLLLFCFVLCVSLCSCATTGLPVTDPVPSVTLPPAEISFVAPIGDAALEYTADAKLYLPSHDGISLMPVPTQVSYSPVRPAAETLVRALLSHAGTKDTTPLGGSVRLSLYGVSPVEVSRDTVTVNLSASALQLDRESLYLTCQAIANTLTELEAIQAVNILVVDKPVGLDIANTLPMGALKKSTAQDLGAVYKQLLSRRVDSSDTADNKPFSANVTLYYPLNQTEGMVSETRAMSFENQVLSDMVVSILRELGAGPSDPSILSPSLPLLADLLTSTPTMTVSAEAGGNVIALEFAHNLDDMLDAYGISRKQSMASLCYTLSTFFPNVIGIRVSVNGSPVDSLFLVEETENTAANNLLLRSDFSSSLYDYCTLYFPAADTTVLRAVQRPVIYNQSSNPRTLLSELSKGPQAYDSQADLTAVMPANAITDTDMLGFALSGDTLLVNFSPSFSEICEGMTAEEERVLAYSLVNTLCMDRRIKSVCFFQSGAQFDGFSGGIYWAGLFYPLPD